MTKLEQFLIRRGMAEMKRFRSGVIVYGFKDEDGFYGNDTVYVRPGSYFELSIGYPYILTLNRNYPSPVIVDSFIADTLSTLESHLRWAFRFRDQLNEIENPWEEVEQ